MRKIIAIAVLCLAGVANAQLPMVDRTATVVEIEAEINQLRERILEFRRELREAYWLAFGLPLIFVALPCVYWIATRSRKELE